MRRLAILWLAVWACGGPGEKPEASRRSGQVSTGTRAMAARLAEFEDATDYTERILALDTVSIPVSIEGRLLHAARRAYFLLQAGRHEDAAAELVRINRIAAQNSRRVPAVFKRDVQDLLATAALWGTIQDACMASTAACLFPFDPAAFPADAEPRVRAALALYETMLRDDPQNTVNAWLLNLAHMILGKYPEQVPASWRLPPDAFRSEYDIGRFRDRGAELGVDVIGHAGGVVLEDFDLDGDLDLLTASRALRDSMRYFENVAGSFVERTAEAGLTGLVGGLNLLQADYDNDGDADVFVVRGAWTQRGQPNSLLRNEGGGLFADVTAEAGVLSVHPTQTADWGDYDNDGWIDLIVGNEAEMWTRPPRAHATELYRNQRDGTFAEVAGEVGLDLLGFVKATQWGDYDNDGRLDLYISRFEEPNQLFHNEGPDTNGVWRFRDYTALAGVDGPLASLPAWFFDYDNDGWLDLLSLSFRVQPEEIILGFMGIRETAETPRLYHNRGDGTFEDVTRAAGLDEVVYVMGSNFGDLDNDGWPDFYLGTGDPDLRTITPNRMFRNDGAGGFQEVTYSSGFGHVAKGHAVAFGDIDFDGDQDLYVVLGGAMQGDVGRNVLWQNPGHGNRWITLRLEGVESNRSAIGTRIRVSIDTPGGPRDVHAVVGSGGSFGGSSLQQEMGLADAIAIREIEIRWQGSGRVDLFQGVPLDRVYALSEGIGELEAVQTTIVPMRGRRSS
jgi:hypothetical protein